jgi:hypothetical protein
MVPTPLLKASSFPLLQPSSSANRGDLHETNPNGETVSMINWMS